MAGDNLLDVVEELRTLVSEFRRLLYGDQASRFPGLVADLDTLKSRLDRVETDVHGLKSKRPVIGMWVGGFIAFVMAIGFAGVAMQNANTTANIFDMPVPLAVILGVCLLLLSLLMFLGGFGWLEK